MKKFFEKIKSADLKQSGAKINQTQRNALSTELKDILSDFLKQFESDSINIERVKNGVAISVENDKLGFVSMELNIVIKDLDYDIVGESENYAFELKEKQMQAELKAKAKAEKIKADKEKRLAKLKEKELALTSENE